MPPRCAPVFIVIIRFIPACRVSLLAESGRCWKDLGLSFGGTANVVEQTSLPLVEIAGMDHSSREENRYGERFTHPG